jgi:hypothetical protein
VLSWQPHIETGHLRTPDPPRPQIGFLALRGILMKKYLRPDKRRKIDDSSSDGHGFVKIHDANSASFRAKAPTLDN